MNKEYRYVPSDFELRGKVGEGATLQGYAAVFDEETTVAGMFREVVESKAFKKTIKESDVRALFNHDSNIVLGRNKAGTLRLSSDGRGLRYEIDLPETQQARDLWTLVDRGDISQSSFSFETIHQRWDEEDGALPLRTLQEVRLYDVSPVTYPQYETTEVEARSILDFAVDLTIPPEGREATTQEPEPGPEEPGETPLDDHPEATCEPEPYRGVPLAARLGLIERM